LGPHSYDPGIAPTLLTWTIPIPEDSIEVDFATGEAVLQLKNVCSVFDAFTVRNSFDVQHALAGCGKTIRNILLYKVEQHMIIW
jgi:hypothetical protein